MVAEAEMRGYENWAGFVKKYQICSLQKGEIVLSFG